MRVLDGAFANFTGTVDDVKMDKQKLKVKVSIFGRPTSVELDFSAVEKRSRRCKPRASTALRGASQSDRPPRAAGRRVSESSWRRKSPGT